MKFLLVKFRLLYSAAWRRLIALCVRRHCYEFGWRWKGLMEIWMDGQLATVCNTPMLIIKNKTDISKLYLQILSKTK